MTGATCLLSDGAHGSVVSNAHFWSYLLMRFHVVWGTPGVESAVCDEMNLGIERSNNDDVADSGSLVLTLDPRLCTGPAGWFSYFVSDGDSVTNGYAVSGYVVGIDMIFFLLFLVCFQ